jgi:hypothetical protein
MNKTLSAPSLLLLFVWVAVLPAAHPEARLFSGGWGAASYIDPNFCLTSIEGQPPRMALFSKTPAVAHALDRLALAGQYLVWGLLLPVLALAAVFHPRGATRHPGWLIFGLLGVMPAWFQWTLNPAFVDLRQWLAEAWLARWPLHESQFIWLDGIALSLWLIGGTLLLGGISLAATRAAAWCAGLDWRRLARDLRPLAGILLFLGLTQTSALYLRGEGVSLDWLPGLRAALLVLAVAGSGWLGLRTIARVGAGGAAHRAVAGLLWGLPLALAAAHGWAMYFHWMNRYHV